MLATFWSADIVADSAVAVGESGVPLLTVVKDTVLVVASPVVVVAVVAAAVVVVVVVPPPSCVGGGLVVASSESLVPKIFAFRSLFLCKSFGSVMVMMLVCNSVVVENLEPL